MGRFGLEAVDDELWQSQRLDSGIGLAYREDDRDGLREQASCRECERLGRGPVEPLRVIDQTDERPLLGCFSEQAQNRQPHEEPIGRRSDVDAEGRSQRVSLRLRQSREATEHRGAELMKRCKGQLHLELHTGYQCHAAPGRLVPEILEQRRLTNARFTADHEGTALTPTNRLDKLVQDLTFRGAAE